MANKSEIQEENELRSTNKFYGYVILGLVILCCIQNMKYHNLKEDYDRLQQEYEYCQEQLHG
ncbi:hypothetical protein SAMN02910292_02561 [Lachnospiraceae bacterium XBB2008]|nr:hypothetical protein SAMN02910292_02561 [Lachnospiraceae bacterium XBB2008]